MQIRPSSYCYAALECKEKYVNKCNSEQRKGRRIRKNVVCAAHNAIIFIAFEEWKQKSPEKYIFAMFFVNVCH